MGAMFWRRPPPSAAPTSARKPLGLNAYSPSHFQSMLHDDAPGFCPALQRSSASPLSPSKGQAAESAPSRASSYVEPVPEPDADRLSIPRVTSHCQPDVPVSSPHAITVRTSVSRYASGWVRFMGCPFSKRSSARMVDPSIALWMRRPSPKLLDAWGALKSWFNSQYTTCRRSPPCAAGSGIVPV